MARWIRVLEAFAESGEWGIRDLARATDIPRSAAHRILHDMAALGLLAPADEPGRFRVGADLARIGLLVAEHLDIRREGRPFLERASAAIGETVVIAVYDPVRRQFSAVDAVETSHPIRYIWESLRDWSDLHLGSSGKGILAFLPPEEQAAILDRLPDPVPGRTAVTKARLRAELEAARRRGYVVSHGERYEGAVGVSAPVRDARGRVVGDLIATWPDNRTDECQGGRGRGRDPERRRRPVATPRLGRTGTGRVTEPIRIGIVGAGRIVASEHVPRFRAIDGVELVGVANRSEESARRAADELGLARAYPSWQALVADPDLDAVLVGAWPMLHAPVTIAALEAGKHVLTEARMAATAEDARAMVRAARAHPDQVAMVVPATFSAWADATIVRLLRDGAIGRVRHVQVAGTRAAPATPATSGAGRRRPAARTSWPSASSPRR